MDWTGNHCGKWITPDSERPSSHFLTYEKNLDLNCYIYMHLCVPWNQREDHERGRDLKQNVGEIEGNGIHMTWISEEETVGGKELNHQESRGAGENRAKLDKV